MSVRITDSAPDISREALGGAIVKADDLMPPSSRAPRNMAEVRLRRATDFTPEEARMRLRAAQAEHPFWSCRLFKAAAAGLLGRDDYKLVFSQYYLYSKNFTRYLAALMANLDSDYHRACLAENLWEEGGGLAPEKRHAEIFRRFLRDSLGVDVDDIDYLDSTRFFVREYLDFCLRSDAAAASAFLSLGTESIVPRMYGLLVDGLSAAGLTEEDIVFFRIHMECDDAHAETLERIMESYSSSPDWYASCLRAMNYALSLRERFFEQLYREVELRRVRVVIDRIRSRESLAPSSPRAVDIHHRRGTPAEPLYDNKNERLNIDFAVERLPFDAEVFDARLVRIPPRRNNEKHKHAHESMFYVIGGTGRVQVNETWVDVTKGDVVFVPRWALHQTQNTGAEELFLLAITDANLTAKAGLGEALKQQRLKDKLPA